MSERETTAYHEAGHAVMAHLVGVRILSASIVPEGETEGHVRHERPALTRRLERTHDGLSQLIRVRPIDDRLRIIDGGPEAEALFTGEPNEERARIDRQLEREVLEELHAEDFWNLDPAIGKHEAELPQRRTRRGGYMRTVTKGELRDQWSSVSALAHELLRHPRMSGDRVHGLLERELGALS